MTRPNQPGSQPGQEMITKTYNEHHKCWYRQIWRQYGWHGQSGALYDLSEDPSKTEKGSFAPLYELVDNDPIEEDV